MDKGLEALLDVLYYNGYIEDIAEIVQYIYTNEDPDHISFPHYLEEYYDSDPARILWSVLVVMFGDYGTSPRYGWIETENKKKCLNELKSWLEVHNLYDGDQTLEFEIE